MFLLSASEDATEVTPCPAGSARGEAYQIEGIEKFTKCKKCDWKLGKYQKDTGQVECKDVPDGSFIGMCCGDSFT